MSSEVSSKSKMSIFSAMCEGFVDFGRTPEMYEVMYSKLEVSRMWLMFTGADINWQMSLLVLCLEQSSES